MDRLPVFKALGDNTRYAIYLEVARSSTPLSTAEVAEALDLHPNTVRPHLERMREAGLLEVETGGQGMVGRPQHRYSIAPDAPSLGLEPSSFRLLSRLVAGVVARAELAEDEIAAVGREHGRSLAGQGWSGVIGGHADPGEPGARAGGPDGPLGMTAHRAAGGPRPLASCAVLLERLLAELGFDPVTADDSEGFTVAFTRCPFGEVAEAFPDVVCHLHRGMVEGIVESVGGARVRRFATLADRDPCQVDLVAG
jgi:predicted ArsR family transcriptional regulator